MITRPLARGNRRPRREPPTAAQMINVLREELFPLPQFAVFDQVRSAVGADVPGLRIADAIAFDTSAGPRIVLHAIEVKRDASDLADEIAHREKGDEIGQFCATFWTVVPAPAKHYLPLGIAFPADWGLIEIDGGCARRLKYPENRRPDPLPLDLLKSILRSAAAAVAAAAAAAPELLTAASAPPRAIGGRIDRQAVWFEGCLHRQIVPLVKRGPAPVRAPCFSCAEKLPPHPDAVAAALDQADPTILERYREQIDRLLRGRRSA